LSTITTWEAQHALEITQLYQSHLLHVVLDLATLVIVLMVFYLDKMPPTTSFLDVLMPIAKPTAMMATKSKQAASSILEKTPFTLAKPITLRSSTLSLPFQAVTLSRTDTEQRDVMRTICGPSQLMITYVEPFEVNHWDTSAMQQPLLNLDVKPMPLSTPTPLELVFHKMDEALDTSAIKEQLTAAPSISIAAHLPKITTLLNVPTLNALANQDSPDRPLPQINADVKELSFTQTDKLDV